MRHLTCSRKRWLTVAAILAVPLLPAQDTDGEPGRGVARISLINGDVSVRRGDSGDWVAAAVNAPLVVQDQIATGPNSRAEVQFDYANMIRLGANTEVRLTELENRRYQMQLARGTIMYVVLRDSQADVEVSTPSASVRPSRRGMYRVTVQDEGQTEVTVRSGELEIYTPRGVERVRSGQTMLVRGTAADPEFQLTAAMAQDDWDRWNERRNRDLERAGSYRYVSRDIYGAEDLDPYGRWVTDPEYGYVWSPVVVAGWAPYRHGRWVWVDWYGWTWVSYDPWGWAPYHYGRWFYAARHGWCWYPGGLHSRHYWSPALVAFFGFGGHSGVHVGFGFGFGNVGWVPLAPHERYHRWYGHGYYGRGYVDRSVNITNNINITNIYRNARVNNGITAVNVNDFSRGRFGNNMVRVSHDQVRQAGLVRGQMPIGPNTDHLRFSDRQVRHTPQAAGNERFFARRQPAAVERVPFAQQERAFRGNANESGRVVTAGPSGDAGRGSRSVPAAADTQRGWRRFGEPARQDQAGTRSGERAAPVVTAPRESNPRSRDANWRRFGDTTPTVHGTESPRQVNPPAARSDTPNRDNNWRRFGDSQRQTTAPPARESSPRSEDRNWRRFGEPNSGSGTAPSAPRGNRGEGQVNRSDRPDSPRQNFDRGPAPRSERSIQVAPPVVRERQSAPRSEPRSFSAPRSESPRSFGGSRGDSGGRVSRGDGGGRVSSSGGGGHASRGGGRR